MDDDSANFTQMQTKILGDYKVGKTLGEGAFSKVKFAIHIPTGEKVAIKIIDKKMMAEANQVSEKDKAARDKKRREKAKEKGIVLPEDPIDPPSDNAFMSQLENEVKLLMRLDHPNIIRTYQVIDSAETCYVVMQYASGGEMMQYMTVKSVLTEKEARRIFRQLVSGMIQIHNANIVHRDLKLENLLLDEDRNILISDFGLGRTYHSDQVHLLKTFCGTPNYAAVELISGIPYVGVKSDVWAMGIILYFMNTGTTPFDGATINELYDNIRHVRYREISERSAELNDLIAKILVKDPAKRIDLEGIRNHPWVCFGGLEPPVSIPPKITGIVGDSSLAKVISSINHDQNHVIYTFHPLSAKKRNSDTKEVLPDELVARKSITISGRTSDQSRHSTTSSRKSATKGSDQLEQWGTTAQAAPLQAKPNVDSLEELKGFGARQSVTEYLPPLPKEKSEVQSTTSSKSPVSSGRRVRAATTGGKRPIIEKPNNDGLKKIVESTTEMLRTENSFSKQDSAPIPEVPNAPVEAKETGTKQEPVQEPKKRQRAATFTTKTGALLRRLSMVASQPSPVDSGDHCSSASHERNSVVMQRMSQVSPTSINPAPISPIEMDIKMDEINQWHSIHHPPKSIRTLKFAFNAAASTSVLDAASMFQDLHNSLMALKEYQSKHFTFTRHPDYYLFQCVCKSEMFKDDLIFDIEICKVWLMNMHALKVKKRAGNAFLFKDVHDRIIHGLRWSK